MNPSEARKRGWKTVGEVAAMLGTTTRTILYYEEEEIIEPKRTARGTRFYSDPEIKRFAIAHRMSCLGFPIRTIKELAQTREASQTGSEAGRKLSGIVDDLVVHIERQLSHLAWLKEDLERGNAILQGCWDCPNRPTRATCPDCPCEVHLDESQLLRLTWDPEREG